MRTATAPCHHIFYNALHRRRLWLEHLSHSFEDYAEVKWTDVKDLLDKKFVRLSNRIILNDELGIQRSLPLESVLDDTPADSFLSSLAIDLAEYEHQFFKELILIGVRLQTPRTNVTWHESLEQTSLLWGRELAQKCLVTSLRSHLIRDKHSVRGLFEAFQQLILGGEFMWKPLLLRRYTNHELQFDLRICPHHHNQNDHTSIADLACSLESFVFKGFARALLPSVLHTRRKSENICIDEFKLQT